MSEKKQEESPNLVLGLGVIFLTITGFLFTVIGAGIRDGVRWSRRIFLNWMLYLLWLALIVYGPRWNLSVFVEVVGRGLGAEGIGRWMDQHFAKNLQYIVFSVIPFCAWLFICGIKRWVRKVKLQRALDHLGLQTSTGIKPKVTKEILLGNQQRKILVQAVGLEVAKFKDRKGALESGWNSIVLDIQVNRDLRSQVEILVSDKELPNVIQFQDKLGYLSKPFTFMVGEATNQFVVADLAKVHHMLVAGATGRGKSYFLRQALVGLLKSSKHLQIYLIDLKRGVEAKPFAALRNVRIAKEELSAVKMLERVVAEMERRFKYLEKKSFNEVVPERDNLDRIVVCIDEASDLFILEKTSKKAKELALQARELTDRLAKLGRAAAIHIILGTQKVIKETIDTRVQTNINAKLCFRVNTLASSMTVLGNKKALELPETKGRAIWSVGGEDIVVQVPLLDEYKVEDEIYLLTQKFNGQDSSLNQPMLDEVTVVKKSSDMYLLEEEKRRVLAQEGQA